MPRAIVPVSGREYSRSKRAPVSSDLDWALVSGPLIRRTRPPRARSSAPYHSLCPYFEAMSPLGGSKAFMSQSVPTFGNALPSYYSYTSVAHNVQPLGQLRPPIFILVGFSTVLFAVRVRWRSSPPRDDED